MLYKKVNTSDPDEYELQAEPVTKKESEPKEKSPNDLDNGLNHDGEKSKLDDELVQDEAQEEKIPYPKSVFFIFCNEICERFSFYGMRTILSLYLRDVLDFSESNSTVIYHTFTMFAYFFPLIGAIISDSWLGKFRTILYVSIIYAIGNILLALASATPLGIPQVPFSLIALFLIAVGTGGIKPCVSSFGGDQFILPQQQKQLVAFFSLFYFSINSGSLISTFLTPIIREEVQCFDEETCYPLAFAIPGILMIISLVIFVAGMPLYKIRKPEGNVIVQVSRCIWYGAKKNIKSKEKREHWLDHAEEKFGRTLVEEVKVTLKVMLVFVPLPIFWTLYDQQGSAWTFLATRMDGKLGSATILPDQMQVINPILILVFIPLFTYGVYPLLAKFNLLKTPLQRMACGGFLAAVAFGMSAGIAAALEATYPELPTDGVCQLRVYNPYNCDATLSIEGLVDRNNVDAMSYKYLKVDCNGTKEYPYQIDHCLLESSNKTGKIKLSEATGYVLYPSTNGFLVLKDDINKPEDGFPRVRILIGNPSKDYNISYYDDGEVELQIPSANNSLLSIDPGTYKFGAQEFEFNLGGVYTVIGQLNQDTSEVSIQKLTSFEITEHNDIHMLLLVPQYVVITAAEILFSITGLEFSYSQAPVSMKSVMTSAFLLTSAFGNLIIVIIESIKIFDRQSYDLLLYTGLMLFDMVLFAFMATKYKYVKKNENEENGEADSKPDKKLSQNSTKE